MGDQNTVNPGQNGQDPSSQNPGVNTPDPTVPDKSEGAKENYSFSMLGLNFSTQFVSGRRIVSSFVSLFLLLVGLGAGIVLVTQPQIFQKKAQGNQNTPTPVCDESAKCTSDTFNPIKGALPCLSRSGVIQCCPVGQLIINNSCVNPPQACDINTKCSLNNKTFGASPCTGADGGLFYCCKKGYSLNSRFGVCYPSL